MLGRNTESAKNELANGGKYESFGGETSLLEKAAGAAAAIR